MRDKLLVGGSLVAALAASLCCIGPLLAVVLGLGTFGAAAAFESLRAYLLGLTALLLGAAFYLAYRRRDAKCEGSACEVKATSRASKIMLWLAALAVIGFATFPYYSGALLTANTQSDSSAKLIVASVGNAGEATVASSSQPKITTAVIGVEGMTCGSCAATVRLALNKVKGISSAEVSFERKEAKISYDPAIVTPGQLTAAINATGFKATDVKVTPDQ